MFEKTTVTFAINKECRGIITAFDLLLFFLCVCVCVYFFHSLILNEIVEILNLLWLGSPKQWFDDLQVRRCTDI